MKNTKLKKELLKLMFGSSGVKDPMQSYQNIVRQRMAENPSSIESPSTALMDNQIREARAMQKANSGFNMGIDLLGNLAMGVGTNMMSQDIAEGDITTGVGKALSGSVDMGSALLNMFANQQSQGVFAFGGEVGKVPVELEGDEVGETPMGELFQTVGPTHEEGGIEALLPEATKVYSDRVKIDGVSMADRKKKREKKQVSLEKLIEKSFSDSLLKNSLDRTVANNEVEEGYDLDIQGLVGALLQGEDGEPDMFATGTNKDGINPLNSIMNFTPTIPFTFGKTPLTPSGIAISESSFEMPNTEGLKQHIENPVKVTFGDRLKAAFSDTAGGGMTLGDGVGMAGNLYNTMAPMKNTLAMRAGDTPNINPYEDFGKEGLRALEDASHFIAGQRDHQLKNIEENRASTSRSLRNSARGVNTMRALDVATNAQANSSIDQAMNSFNQYMTQLYSQKAQALNQRDQMVMRGEDIRDTNDRHDRGAFFSQLSQDMATRGRGLQEIGKDLNAIKQNETIMNILNQMSKYGITIGKDGKLNKKE